jgi:hypothetical protein
MGLTNENTLSLLDIHDLGRGQEKAGGNSVSPEDVNVMGHGGTYTVTGSFGMNFGRESHTIVT